MTKLISRTAVAMALGLFILSAAASAQTPAMRVNVPFAFLAGEQAHPAGEYIVTMDARFGVVSLQPAKSGPAERIFVNRSPVARTKGGSAGYLRFEKVGAAYALRGVWPCDANEGYELKGSRSESETARAISGGTVTATDVSAFVR